MRSAACLAATVLLAGCASTGATWSRIERPWTSEVVDVQRRVRVTPVAGAPFEAERPLYRPNGADVLAWRGAGPDARYPERAIALAEVRELEAANSKAPALGREKLAGAGTVALGVVLWTLLLVAIFA